MRKPIDLHITHYEDKTASQSPASSPNPSEIPIIHHASYPPSTPTKTQSELDREAHLAIIRTKIGLTPSAPILAGHETHHHLTWSGVRVVLREPFAEFFGVFIMILFGNGSVAQVVLSTGQSSAPGGNGFGGYQSINWGYVLSLSFFLLSFLFVFYLLTPMKYIPIEIFLWMNVYVVQDIRSSIILT